jgi:hypothetical protein
MVIGTVTTSDRVDRSRAEADSASNALYLEANSTTAVASGKLQQTTASRANGPCTCKSCSRPNRMEEDREQRSDDSSDVH